MLLGTTTPSRATPPAGKHLETIAKLPRREGWKGKRDGRREGRGKKEGRQPFCHRTFLIYRYIHKKGISLTLCSLTIFSLCQPSVAVRMPEVNEPKYEEGLLRLAVETSGYNQLAVTIWAYALWQ
jgi:hypothetical protein